jgi:hypothetical protein
VTDVDRVNFPTATSRRTQEADQKGIGSRLVRNRIPTSQNARGSVTESYEDARFEATRITYAGAPSSLLQGGNAHDDQRYGAQRFSGRVWAPKSTLETGKIGNLHG